MFQLGKGQQKKGDGYALLGKGEACSATSTRDLAEDYTAWVTTIWTGESWRDGSVAKALAMPTSGPVQTLGTAAVHV